MGGEAPSEPLMFLVPNTAVVGPGDPVVLPPQSSNVHYEGELAVVIGRMCKDVAPEEAASVIFGYTCANDVTARDLQFGDGQWARAKGFDTFCPLGPWIETDLDPADLSLVTRVDGEVVQDGHTSDMVHGVAALIAHASAAFTLLPGDVILTGTPAGVGPVEPGQRVEVEIQDIGTLSNPFVRH
jgi:2-keto-4-pentenoate hydratase/2-oxohepta-3-ene-1,7-dioic acid hydratase in catechol pathway